MFEVLSSYLVRRETCGLTKKPYNVTFMQILRELRKTGFSVEVLISYLRKLDGPTSLWPDDSRFTAAITARALYAPGSSLCRVLLAAAANRIGAAHASEVQWSPDWSQLHLEHLLPQSWYAYWTLPDGTSATEVEAERAKLTPASEDPAGKRIAAIIRRESAVNILGNLTILNSEINQEIKNHAWHVKREAILGATQLRMNYDIARAPIWDEARIAERGLSLAAGLCEVFRGPLRIQVTKSND
jgi:hypothetical protein